MLLVLEELFNYLLSELYQIPDVGNIRKPFLGTDTPKLEFQRPLSSLSGRRNWAVLVRAWLFGDFENQFLLLKDL